MFRWAFSNVKRISRLKFIFFNKTNRYNGEKNCVRWIKDFALCLIVEKLKAVAAAEYSSEHIRTTEKKREQHFVRPIIYITFCI